MPRILEEEVFDFFEPTLVELTEAPDEDKKEENKKTSADNQNQGKSDLGLSSLSASLTGDSKDDANTGDKDDSSDLFGTSDQDSGYSLTDIGKVYTLKRTFSTISSLIGYGQDIIKKHDNPEVNKLVKSLIEVQDYLFVVASNIDKYLDKIDTILELYTKLIKEVTKRFQKYVPKEDQENEEQQAKEQEKKKDFEEQEKEKKEELEQKGSGGIQQAQQQISSLFSS